MKSYQSKKNSAAFQTKLEKFEDESKKLFDFASCKRKDMEIAIVLRSLTSRLWKEVS